MTINILMPALSPTMTEGKIVTWLKREGDAIESGDVLAEIETDKATMEVEAADEGVLGKIIVSDGTEGVAVNSVIAVLLEDGEDASALDAMTFDAPAIEPGQATAPQPATPPTAPVAAAPVAAPLPAPPAASTAAQSTGGRIRISPLAKRMAANAGLDATLISGTGPGGRIVKRDIDGMIAAGGTMALPTVISTGVPAIGSGGYSDVPHSTMRKIIAQRLQQSKQTVPHFYLTIDCEIDAVLDARRKLNSSSPEGEGAYKVSVNDFIVRAVALALRKVPAANASWTPDAIRLYNDVDVCVAVATPGGLITPVVRHADTKGLATISAEVKDLAARGRDGKLMPEEYQGGGFTISNLGMFGIKEFSAIINPPQACILAIGAGEPRPVVRNGEIKIATMMSCTLSSDHRVVDGAVGAEFLAAFKGFIDEPYTMLL